MELPFEKKFLPLHCVSKERGNAELAQLVEQRIRNAWVGGSSPPFGSKRKRRDAVCDVCGVAAWCIAHILYNKEKGRIYADIQHDVSDGC